MPRNRSERLPRNPEAHAYADYLRKQVDSGHIPQRDDDRSRLFMNMDFVLREALWKCGLHQGGRLARARAVIQHIEERFVP